MKRSELISYLRDYPMMVIPDRTPECLIGFLYGVDIGSERRFLAGYREWLLGRYGIGSSSLGWPALVREFEPELAGIDASAKQDRDYYVLIVDTLQEFFSINRVLDEPI